MLRLLLQSIEQFLGSTITTISQVAYWGGLLFVLFSATIPIWKQLIELSARRMSLEQHWVMACTHCQNRTLVIGKTCGFCGEGLNLPLYLRLWSRIPSSLPSWQYANLRWALHTLAAIFFVASTAVLFVAMGGHEPTGDLHRLFLGLSFLALGSVGWFLGQSLSLHTKGLLPRLRDGLLACCAMGALITLLFLGSQTKPIPETLLATFSTETHMALIGNRELHLPTGQIGFEYLQVDHELLGIHHIVPLAFLGDDRLPVNHGSLSTAIIQHLKTNPDRYTSRGITIRVRIDQHQTTAGESYEVVQRDGQVLVRKTSGPLFVPDVEHS